MQSRTDLAKMLSAIPESQHVLIAGPTASGKSALALQIAQESGGVIVNADASQVYDCWRVLTARPSAEEEALAPHRLYGHVPAHKSYSTGHWLREVAPLLSSGARLIIVGGTGLYFTALTKGLADIPATPPDVRGHADTLPLETLRAALDAETSAGLDLSNRARVQRAWEVQEATGKSLAFWQGQSTKPILQLSDCTALCLDVDKAWLNERIAKRFDVMLAEGVLQEVSSQRSHYDPQFPAHRAIGVTELLAHIAGEITLEEAREKVVIATRQFAKRQRTWLRSKMADWQHLPCP